MTRARSRPGALFVAIPGQHHDGHDHVPAAVAAGAVGGPAERAAPGLGVPQVLVARVAAGARRGRGLELGRSRATDLGVVGITGTDGKTTTAYLVRSMLEACGLADRPAGHHRRHRGRPEPGQPGSCHDARGARAPGAPAPDGRRRATAGRSSSRPPTGWPRSASARSPTTSAVHTNVTHEHLEFHRTPEAYRAAKRRLFERLAVGPANPDKGYGKHAVVNLDDPLRRALRGRRGGGRGHAPRLRRRPDGAATIRAVSVREARRPATSAVRTPRWEDEVRAPPGGPLQRPQHARGHRRGRVAGARPGGDARRAWRPWSGCPAGWSASTWGSRSGSSSTTPTPPTRWPRRSMPWRRWPPPAAAGSSASSARPVTATRAKRPMMGRVAGERCRLVVVTDEDPRSEDRMAILDADRARAPSGPARSAAGTCCSSPTGATAIRAAIDEARPGDVVVLAGKGHERTHRDGRRPGRLGRGRRGAGRPGRAWATATGRLRRDGAARRRA